MCWDFPGGSDGKASACNAGDPGSIPGSEDPLEKEMATHSSTLAWKIPWIEEPCRLQSLGSQRVRHDWVTSLTRLTRYTIYCCVSCVLSHSAATLWNPLGCSPAGSSVHWNFPGKSTGVIAIASPGALPDPGMEPASPVSPALQADSLPAEPSGKPCIYCWRHIFKSYNKYQY